MIPQQRLAVFSSVIKCGMNLKINYKEVLLSVAALTAVILFSVFALLLFVSLFVLPFLLVKTRN